MTDVVEVGPGFTGPVRVVQDGPTGVRWLLAAEHVYIALDGTRIVVPPGASTDGASVPRPFAWLVPRSGRWIGPAITHDHAYRYKVPSRQQTYREADALLREGMRLQGVSVLMRLLIWAAVRWAGLFRNGGRAGWWRDAPQVLGITLLALPVVAVPTVAVTLGLAVWWLFEAVAYLVLLAFGRPDRYVNAPRDLAKS